MAERRLPIRILVADDDPVSRKVLRAHLRRTPKLKIIGEAETGVDAVRLTQELKPDVLLLELLLPIITGMDALRQLTTDATKVRKVLLCSYIQPQQVLEALHLGACGIVNKNSIKHVVPCIAAVLEGRCWVDGRRGHTAVEVTRELISANDADPAVTKTFKLTPRELHIIRLASLGQSNREIAKTLSISEETVKRHLANVYNKVGMSTRLELAMFAIDHNLIHR